MDAVAATFSGFKLVQGRKVAQLILEVDIDLADAALHALGGLPKPDAPQWVGVAPIREDAAKNGGQVHTYDFGPIILPPPFSEKPKGGKLAQRAGIVCALPAFWRFVREEGGHECENADEAARRLRELCGIESRAELDHNEVAGNLFSALDASFRQWLRS